MYVVNKCQQLVKYCLKMVMLRNEREKNASDSRLNILQSRSNRHSIKYVISIDHNTYLNVLLSFFLNIGNMHITNMSTNMPL